MCEYCNLKEDERKELDKSIYLSIGIGRSDKYSSKYWYLYAFETDDTEIKINYCPICGRELD